MVDRLEELLALMEDEDEDGENEGESIPAVRDRTVPAAAARSEDGGEAAGSGGKGWSAPADPEERGPERSARETEESAEDGPVWRLGGGTQAEAEAVRRQALAERADWTERLAETGLAVQAAAEAAGARLSAETGGELAGMVRHEAESGLEELYRQAVQADRPAPQALPVEQAGRTVRAEEPGRTAALTVDELDRAVRRDSRRYDGGMTIF